MPIYLCRWPNGDCSVVRANNRGEAVELLDEFGNAEGCPLIPLPTFMMHLRISDEGEVEFDSFGEATEHVLFELAYPLLSEVLLNVPTDEAGNPTPEGLIAISDAVAKERERIRRKKVKEPDTERGREMKKLIRAPTRIIDRVIRESATKLLKRFPVKGKPN